MGALLDLALTAVGVQAGAIPITDERVELRRQRVMKMLLENPGLRRALITDTEAEPEAVILALAIRGAMPDEAIVTCEMRIPKAKYDPFLLLDLFARHSGGPH
jgi:hypothetical protein